MRGSVTASLPPASARIVLAVWAVARRRQGWLRWLFLILFVIGAVSAIYWTFDLIRQIGAELYLRDAILMRPIPIIATTVYNFAEGFALFFVLTGDAPPWFRKKRQQIDPEVFS